MRFLQIYFVSGLIFLFFSSSLFGNLNFTITNHSNSIVDTEFILKKLEINSTRIMNSLGVEIKGNFNIHIWTNYNDYLSFQVDRMGVSFPGSKGWVISSRDIAIFYCDIADEIAEHEFAHCVSMFVNSNIANNPRWLWEAVAIYESGEFYEPNELAYLKNGTFPTIHELNTGFNNGGYKIYQVGYLLIEFVIYKWGKEKYLGLIRRNGLIPDVLSISVEEFEAGWRDFVNLKYLNISSINNANIDHSDYKLKVYNSHIVINSGCEIVSQGTLDIYRVLGEKIFSTQISENQTYFGDLPQGNYIFSIRNGLCKNSFKISISN